MSLPTLPIEALSGPMALLGLVAAVEALGILGLLGANRRLRSQLRRRKATDVPAGAESGRPHKDLASLYEKALTGSLDRYSVVEVLQFLNSIQETGILDIVDKKLASVHRMILSNGEIVDAFNGSERGEPAVFAIMKCTLGTFTFIRGDIPITTRVVRKPTMTLLMESMQHLDEQQSARVAAPEPARLLLRV